jgi:TolA-binding protein
MRNPILLTLAAAAACATAPAVVAPVQRPQAAAKLPAPNDLPDPAQRSALSDALVHARLGDAARDAGDLDRARGEWRAAGTGFAALGRPPGTYRMVFLAAAARTSLQAGDLEAAAQAAELLQADPDADASTRAVGARLRAGALGQIATNEVKAGRLEALSTAGADKRRGKALEPRPPAEPWQRLGEADDAYVASYRADPDPGAAESAAGAAYQAALIQYSSDRMDEAARRFLAVVEGFPGARYQEEAATLYLQTFLVRGDVAGHAAAIDRLQALIGGQARKAAEAATQGGNGEAKARADLLAKLEGQLRREKQGLGFSAASRLLSEGKARDAATAFERFAADYPDHPDAPSALYNAAIAWSQVKEPKKALAAREQVLARYPDARVAPKALLAAAGDLSAGGDHAGAARLYSQYLERYPAGDDRCLALLDAGAELDIARQSAEASRRYLAYGTDARCTKEDPNNAARLLYRAAAIFNRAGNRPDTQAALKALASLAGVTDAQAKAYVEDARSRVK